ncbi:MAG: hypothetical protein ABW022_25660, partial [Actinoplanes sp.]
MPIVGNWATFGNAGYTNAPWGASSDSQSAAPYVLSGPSNPTSLTLTVSSVLDNFNDNSISSTDYG